MYISVTFSTFTMLCNPYHHHIQDIFYLSKLNLHIRSSLPLTQNTTVLFSVSVIVTTLGNSCRWNNIESFVLW